MGLNYLVANDKGETVDFLITSANVNDRQPLKDKTFHKKFLGRFLEIKRISVKTCIIGFL